jgi:hypothetical protein
VLACLKVHRAGVYSVRRSRVQLSRFCRTSQCALKEGLPGRQLYNLLCSLAHFSTSGVIRLESSLQRQEADNVAARRSRLNNPGVVASKMNYFSIRRRGVKTLFAEG